MNGQIIIGIIPLLIQIIRVVEEIILGKKKGKVKKKLVLRVIKEIADALIASGIIKNEQYKSFIIAMDEVIDKVVEIMNKRGIFHKEE